MEQLEVAEVAIDEGALAWRGQMYEEVAKVQQVVGAIVLEVESGRKVVQVGWSRWREQYQAEADGWWGCATD